MIQKYDMSQVAQAAGRMNRVGLSLMASLQTAGGGSESSVLLSPLSIVSSLAMVSLGTTPDGVAQRELLSAWDLEESEVLGFLDYMQRQLAAVSDGTGKVEMQSANSIWVKASILDSYINNASERLDAVAKPLPADPGPINAWCSEATKGMVPSILEEIDPLTVAVLVNAVYLKGMWADEFEQTFRGQFQVAQKSRPCAMMRRESKHMLYAERPGYQVVELPYGSDDGRLAAVVVLPGKEEGAFAELLGSLARDDGLADDGATQLLQVLDEGLEATPVELQLPRFELEFGTDLAPVLQSALGIRQVFTGEGEFLRMSTDRDVHLSAVFQKAKIEVNERGTKAAAATGAVMMTRSMPLPPLNQRRVVVDHPFLFLIRDRPTGTLLFAGAVVDPVLDTAGV